MTDKDGNLALTGGSGTAMATSSLVVIERMAGDVSLSKLKQLTANMVERWDPSVRIHLLTDLTDANLGRLSFREVVEFVQYTERMGLYFRAPRVAIVATGGATHTIAKLFQSLLPHDDRSVLVFSDVSSALAWLRGPGAPVGTA